VVTAPDGQFVPDASAELWQVVLDDGPDDVEVDVEVAVDDPVAEAADPAPGDLGMSSSEAIREPLGGLPTVWRRNSVASRRSGSTSSEVRPRVTTVRSRSSDASST